jgi:hypothetical protein
MKTVAFRMAYHYFPVQAQKLCSRRGTHNLCASLPLELRSAATRHRFAATKKGRACLSRPIFCDFAPFWLTPSQTPRSSPSATPFGFRSARDWLEKTGDWQVKTGRGPIIWEQHVH